ncbi:MAG: type II toxin-antitoxin system Phd/YefM family antitoxin [Vicinamibacteria bacterium]
MKIAPLAEVKAQFSRYVEECESGPIVVTKNGRPVAVIVSAQDEDELERLILAHTPALRSLLQAAEKRIVRTGGLPHDEFWNTAMGSSAFAERNQATRAFRQRKNAKK